MPASTSAVAGSVGDRAGYEIDRPREVLDVEQAVAYLRDVGALWAESLRRLQ